MVVVSTNRSIFQGSNLHTLLALTLILKATIPFNGTGSGPFCQTKPIKIKRIFNQQSNKCIPRTLYTKRRVKMPMDLKLQTPEIARTGLQVPRQRFDGQK